jgi:hypothetical protein
MGVLMPMLAQAIDPPFNRVDLLVLACRMTGIDRVNDVHDLGRRDAHDVAGEAEVGHVARVPAQEVVATSDRRELDSLPDSDTKERPHGSAGAVQPTGSGSRRNRWSSRCSGRSCKRAVLATLSKLLKRVKLWCGSLDWMPVTMSLIA